MWWSIQPIYPTRHRNRGLAFKKIWMGFVRIPISWDGRPKDEDGVKSLYPRKVWEDWTNMLPHSIENGNNAICDPLRPCMWPNNSGPCHRRQRNLLAIIMSSSWKMNRKQRHDLPLKEWSPKKVPPRTIWVEP